MIEFSCSACGKSLKVQDDAAGKQGKCPQCEAILLVPQPEMVTLEAADQNPSVPPHPSGSKRNTHGPVSSTQSLSTKRRKHRIWLVLLILVALILAPFVPQFPLLLGVILLLTCVLAIVPQVQMIPQVQEASWRLLRLDSNHILRNGARLTIYALIGLILVLCGYSSAEHKEEQRKIAAHTVAEKAEQHRLASEANQNVAAVAKEAETAWQQGDSALANAKLKKAEMIPHATNLNPIRRLQSRMANAQVKSLMAEAAKMLQAGEIDSARLKIEAALAVPFANALQEARQLAQRIKNATDPAHIRAVLMELSDDAFQKLVNERTIPSQLAYGYEALDKRAKELALAQVDEVAAEREGRRQTELLAQRRQEDEQRRAAETARKAREEHQAQEIARREAAQKEVKDRLDAYVALLNAADVKLIDSVSVRRSGGDTWEATLTVDNIWHIRHYQIRLQDAQVLWEAWARIASPKNPDSARIKIVDQRGNEVGGSRFLAGSLIWVKED